ncbi:sigma-70 family RNA polymerase sigma factor [Streptomyces tubbatahanensis]|uniref:Sigma-70 family RNA polymerase sigma factor n=1 Tax=Streptomyces tubbatahanensis TaxID=2923272 RepID=A0ABY3Y380_9ACTN|nr:sigma-70 family RNA polymerase sigma factor [Streptomyces tubbatahanensis]UNT01081.1 sigma-70 family RNA polymerase sigma factor [Streptomyces tubbatahanensis]
MRKGDDGAYEELYRRHAEPVRRYARTCCRDADTAEDLTGEVFARTLQAVCGGKGPRTAVRAYLLTSVRHVAAAWTRTRRRERLVDDFAVFVQSAAAASARDVDTLDLGADVRAMHKAEQTLVVRAFESLSEHDRMLLWHTAVEGGRPQDVAVLLGTSRGAVATAAHRAREHLKQAYLQAHVSQALTQGGECARYADRLGAYARGGLRMRAERGLARHLEECPACSQAASEVKDLNEHIRLVLPVALIGWFGTAGGAKAFAALLGGGAAAGGAAAGGAGAGAGGAASEGLGAPAKVGIGLGVAAAAGAVLAYALTGGDEPVEKPRARPSPPHAAPDQPPRKPDPAPPEPRQEPRKPTGRPPAPGPEPVRAAPRRPAQEAAPVRRPGPRPSAPEPPRSPDPEPPTPPPPSSPPARPSPPAPEPAERHLIRVTERGVVLESTTGERTVRLVVERQPDGGTPDSVASWSHSLSRQAAASARVRGAPTTSVPSSEEPPRPSPEAPLETSSEASAAAPAK